MSASPFPSVATEGGAVFAHPAPPRFAPASVTGALTALDRKLGRLYATLADVLRDLAHDLHRAEGDIFAARVALEIAEGAFSAAPTLTLARLVRRNALDPHRPIGDGIASRLALEVLSRRIGATPAALLIRLSRRLRRLS